MFNSREFERPSGATSAGLADKVLQPRRPAVAVITEDQELQARLVEDLRRSGLVDLDPDRTPDFVCLGCGERIPVKDLEAARRIGGDKRFPIVLMTLNGSEDLAVQAFRQGINEYLRVPFSCRELESVVRSLCPPRLATGLVGGERFVGGSRTVREIKAYLEKLARTSSHVLITGETGTGKELVAELIHKNGARANRPLVCINCAAIPDTLLESELFGYERGAFTGALVSQDGKLKLADGGTLFLDEIGDMSPYAQAKVLRVIESREIQRLGNHKSQPIDFRLIAATNRDLDSVAREGTFRRDLFFRLNVARIHLPPLRERKEDIPAVADFFRREDNRKFGRETTGFAPQAVETLWSHDWPGNVRELKNLVEAAFINLEPGAALVELPAPFSEAVRRKESIGMAELDRILLALSETRWNKSQAAERLHWSRMTLYRKMIQYSISKPSKLHGWPQQPLV
jgi:DNA-binding NtrC family response regulator